MPLPGSHRMKQLLQEINTPEPTTTPEFLQEIKEPEHEEVIVEAKPKTSKKKRRSKKS
jgi:hypothetical protein